MDRDMCGGHTLENARERIEEGNEPPGWCERCGRQEPIPARDLLAWFLEDGSDLEGPTSSPNPLSWPGYDDQRRRAVARTGLAEAVIAQAGTLCGSNERIVAIAYDFRFLGGSMGTDAGQLVAAAYDEARRQRLPVVVFPQTGGARMQEGMAALYQMAATSVAAAQHAEAGLLQIAVLCDPTTGGVYASHASQADVILGERGARIGFAGPRSTPTMVHASDQPKLMSVDEMEAAGLIDEAVDRPDIPDRVAAILRWVRPGDQWVSSSDDRLEPRDNLDADPWDAVQAARAGRRPRLRAYLQAIGGYVALRGDRSGTDDPTVVVALGKVGGLPVVVIGTDRTARGGQITAAGYRKAWRGIDLAERLNVPIVTLIDTPGADASLKGDSEGVAHHIAWSFRRMLSVDVATACLVIGEGGSGGALALAVCDRLLMQEGATFYVISPEAVAAILKLEDGDVPSIASQLQPTAMAAQRLGIIDAVVPEPSGKEVERAVQALADHLTEEVSAGADGRTQRRRQRWRQLTTTS